MAHTGQGGYKDPASCRVPKPSHRGTKSTVAHKWAGGLHNLRLHRASPTLETGGYNEKWPRLGPGGYIAPNLRGIPNG